jgi:hypothetical protein
VGLVGESKEMQDQCAEIAIRADRRIGEILAEMPKRAGSRGVGKKVESQKSTPLPPTLADMGLDKKQSEYAVRPLSKLQFRACV